MSASDSFYSMLLDSYWYFSAGQRHHLEERWVFQKIWNKWGIANCDHVCGFFKKILESDIESNIGSC